jgi:hypothetical protein
MLRVCEMLQIAVLVLNEAVLLAHTLRVHSHLYLVFAMEVSILHPKPDGHKLNIVPWP